MEPLPVWKIAYGVKESGLLNLRETGVISS
jgi:hypothetical protein